ncbi:hypothetical protein G6F63_016648 [Rhizopus arrhizus]|nr:hypothetical protein G6F63_016648 [Rhizopus arrhizus]
MVGAVGKLAASRLAIAADGDAGLAPGVLQLAAHGRAVTFIVGGAQSRPAAGVRVGARPRRSGAASCRARRSAGGSG